MTTLPLMESALLSTVAKSLVQIEIEPRPLIPTRPLDAREQYRFHFDMTKCIGCKCCVVACNEQNGNPAALNWRRVGEFRPHPAGLRITHPKTIRRAARGQAGGSSIG